MVYYLQDKREKDIVNLDSYGRRAAHQAFPCLENIPAASCMDAATMLDHSITVAIVYSSGQSHRHLRNLVRSVRHHHGSLLPIIVAVPSRLSVLSRWNAQQIVLPMTHGGPAVGRNAIVRAAQTRFLAFIGADTELHDNTSLPALLAMMKAAPDAALAGGCARRFDEGSSGCGYLTFYTSDDGSVVIARSDNEAQGVDRVHMVSNFFLARTAVLRRFGWDSRQRALEQESFFYQLYLNRQIVLACPRAVVWKNVSGDVPGRRAQQSAQYLCKNFPEVRRFVTPTRWWHCDTHQMCTPNYDAQFAFDSTKCEAFAWDAEEDDSVMPRPLVGRYLSERAFPPVTAPVPSGSSMRHVPLLVIIFTQAQNVKRRAEQRNSWLFLHWHRGPRDPDLVPWRHLYVRARSSRDNLTSHAPRSLDEVFGDTLTLSRVSEDYRGLVFKTLEAFRWVLDRQSFGALLKTDDDSLVHVGRLWHWLFEGPVSHNLSWIYAGRLINDSQVLRPDFSWKDVWHPEWYPANFKAWAVPKHVYTGTVFPPYCSGGGYVLGRAATAAIREVYTQWPTSRVVPLEDAFLGILAQAAQLRPTCAPGFTDLLLDATHPQMWDDALMRTNYADKLLVHRVARPQKAVRFLMMSMDAPSADLSFHRKETFSRWESCVNCEGVLF